MPLAAVAGGRACLWLLLQEAVHASGCCCRRPCMPLAAVAGVGACTRARPQVLSVVGACRQKQEQPGSRRRGSGRWVGEGALPHLCALPGMDLLHSHVRMGKRGHSDPQLPHKAQGQRVLVSSLPPNLRTAHPSCARPCMVLHPRIHTNCMALPHSLAFTSTHSCIGTLKTSNCTYCCAGQAFAAGLQNLLDRQCAHIHTFTHTWTKMLCRSSCSSCPAASASSPLRSTPPQ